MQNSLQNRVVLRQGCLSALLLVGITGVPRTGDAMIVSRFNPSNPSADYNTTAPADDPGWYNVSDNSSAPSGSYIYLGNQWVLTAGHVGVPTSSGLQLANGLFPVIPGTDVRLTNPTGDYWQRKRVNNQDVSVFEPLTTNSDLRMFRVNTDVTTGLRPEDLNPGIKQISIASTAPSIGTNLVMVGLGRDRIVNTDDVGQQGLFHYDVDKSANLWTWSSPLDEGGDYHGFHVNNNDDLRRKRWGTNAVSPDDQLEQGWNISDTNNQIVTTINNGNDVLSLIAKFDQLGITSNEAMAAAGDSGGPVFFKDAAGQWQLAGVMHAIYILSGQHTLRAVYGDWTAFSDLSNPHYYQQIAGKRAESNYSALGDINLDGIVSGNGAGAWAADDVTAFVQGWLYEQAEGDILSWKRGDLNQDGITDLNDFALLRTALGGSIATADLQALLSGSAGGNTVPEPGSFVLMLGIFSGLLWLFRPRRRWALARVRRPA
ncbi:MAG: hypothetical protein WD851_16895 [Pirellulales bacterium]